MDNEKTVIVCFSEADYRRLLTFCQLNDIDLASYIEESAINALNEEGIYETTNTQ